jgi:hypothetical protein
MDTTVLLLVAALAGLLFLWLRFRRKRTDTEDAGGHPSRADALDTVAGWPPEATRVLTHPERRAYSMLTNALPDYMVLAQVPVSRFIRVPTRNSYTEWMRRVGQLCADLVVCDKGAQVIAVVEIRRPAPREGDRSRRRHERMDRVLRKAGIRVLEWNEEALPHPDTVREQVLPTPKDLAAPSTYPGVASRPAPAASPMPRAAPATLPPIPVPTVTALRGAGAASVVAAATASAARPAAPPPATLDEVLEEIDRADAAAELTLPEPTPSTWFDEYDSSPSPLHPAPPKERQNPR